MITDKKRREGELVYDLSNSWLHREDEVKKLNAECTHWIIEDEMNTGEYKGYVGRSLYNLIVFLGPELSKTMAEIMIQFPLEETMAMIKDVKDRKHKLSDNLRAAELRGIMPKSR